MTSHRKFHFEFSNQFDILQRTSFPNVKQNTADFELNYGLFKNVEIAIQTPLITIINARGRSPSFVSGVGDLNLSGKYSVYKEQEGSSLPAMSVSVNMKLPTGDAARQLGSGLRDYSGNLILQKSLTDSTTMRFNSGVLFAGKQDAEATGMKAQGRVYTGGASLVKKITPKLSLGGEITGAVTNNLELGKRQLQIQVGGNYSISRKSTFDFGIVAGRFQASPRIGGQLGLSFDL